MITGKSLPEAFAIPQIREVANNCFSPEDSFSISILTTAETTIYLGLTGGGYKVDMSLEYISKALEAEYDAAKEAEKKSGL